MHLITALFLVTLLVSLFLAITALTAGKKSLTNREKLSPFECGFDPYKKARAPFSLRFFMTTILFLVFDVEVALLLPLGFLSNSSNPAMILFTALSLTIILVLGLLHEWNQGTLVWAN